MTEVKKKKEIVYCSRYPLFSIFTECLISKGWLAVTLLSCETSKKQHSIEKDLFILFYNVTKKQR